MADVLAESPGSDRGVRPLHRADSGTQTTLLFFFIEHGRRKILHCNITRRPTAEWIVQQQRETFSETCPYRYVILDRDSKFDDEVITSLTATGLKPKRTIVQAPWQNGIAERWVGSCRREVLDHVIALNEQHIRRLIRDYVNYYHEDRIHDSLEKDTPNRSSKRQRRKPPRFQPRACLAGMNARALIAAISQSEIRGAILLSD